MNCSHCGAPLPMSSDGFPGACGYCNAGRAKAVDPVSLAKTLERDIADVRRFVEGLASLLESTFAQVTEVERSGLFTKHVAKVVVTLEGHVYRLEVDGDRAASFRSRVVRGVTVKNEPLPLSKWVNELARALAHEAEANAHAREALSKLLG